MNWDAISAVGQVGGAIVVGVSLLYLAAQVRQANRHAEASSLSVWMDGWNNAIKGWTDDPKTIRTLRSGFNDLSNLDADQQAVFHLHMAAMRNQWLLAADVGAGRIMHHL